MAKEPKKKVSPPLEKAMCLRGGCGHPESFHTEIGCVGHSPITDFESEETCGGACPSFVDTIPAVEPSTEMIIEEDSNASIA